MSINQLLAENANVSLSVSIADLKEFAQCLIAEASALATQKAKAATSAPNRYLTPKQVCERLCVRPCTLWRWEKKAYLTPQRIGGKVLYQESDLQRLVLDKEK